MIYYKVTKEQLEKKKALLNHKIFTKTTTIFKYYQKLKSAQNKLFKLLQNKTFSKKCLVNVVNDE